MSELRKHPKLDRPIWNSLTSKHIGFAVGANCSKRFEDDVSPFAASVGEDPDSLSELESLIPTDGKIKWML